MKVKTFCSWTLLLLALCGATGWAQTRKNEICLVKDGKARGHLFLPAKMGRPLLLATEELREYIGKMTGAELPLAYRGPDLRHRRDVGIQLLVRDPS